ncbi:hypothetical protein E3N88_12590 [Mikania micrantha]|uniref:Uncharacterized protein n=1 Tax=Mikania micrantha TaxID=192012 RepID=A0A5N6P5Y5_9ASTR|nr:hypothetical protein E3N88_12590 [Mikania micrantha]
MMQQSQIDDLAFCPSFNCYSSDSLASTAAGRISTQLQQERAAQFHDVDEDEFEFLSVIENELLPPEYIDSDDRLVFPLFNRDLLIQNEVDREITQIRRGKLVEEETACSNSLQKLFINEREESASSSSEAEESDGEAPAVFCVWRHKTDTGASPLSKCKKSSSTGSGSKRWRIRDLLRRSYSDGKEPMVLLTHKKVEIPKQKLSSGESSIVAGKSKPSSPSLHEFFYVQQRAKREIVKRKSYLPYRQGLVGFFSNVNGNRKKSTL